MVLVLTHHACTREVDLYFKYNMHNIYKLIMHTRAEYLSDPGKHPGKWPILPFPRLIHNATSIVQILIFYSALDSSRRDNKSFAARTTQKRPKRRARDRLFNIFRTPLAKKSSLFAAVPERVA